MNSSILTTRSSGVLLHPTSLPGPHGIGDWGHEAADFIDFLKSSGQTWWQMLPLGPTGFGNSPYNTHSAFAGNPLLISLEKLAEQGLLTKKDARPFQKGSSTRIAFESVSAHKNIYLRKAYREFKMSAAAKDQKSFGRFCSENTFWLDDYALYCSIKEKKGGASWVQWGHTLAQPKLKDLEQWSAENKSLIEYFKFLQYEFFSQWNDLKAYAVKKKIFLIGDIPIFVAYDSADVWAHQEFFKLKSDGSPQVVAGVPPDYFSETGQLWGNPVYRWEVLKKQRYDWWIKRMKWARRHYDAIRLDHFIGFIRVWEVPATARTALQGHWGKGPKEDFFKQVYRSIKHPQLIAEDLGCVTPEVIALREKFKLPGMHILQFAFGNGDEEPEPQDCRENCFIYPGTHDNNTLVGWFKSLDPKMKRHVKKYFRWDREFHWKLLELTLSSPAIIAIVPAQDLLGLGSQARMNLPGTSSGNWEWRLKSGALNKKISTRLKILTKTYDRIPYSH